MCLLGVSFVCVECECVLIVCCVRVFVWTACECVNVLSSCCLRIYLYGRDVAAAKLDLSLPQQPNHFTTSLPSISNTTPQAKCCTHRTHGH